jgi:putative nucleotidyltransferase with HDIG domain
MPEGTATSRSRHRLGTTFSQLRGQLCRLGLNLRIWDRQREDSWGPGACCELCRTLSEGGHGCESACAEVAKAVVQNGRRKRRVLDSGCCVLGMPLYRRRRVIGAATVCYASRELLEEESLWRLCSRLKLDREAVAGLARASCRYGLEEAQDLFAVVDWLLKREQSHATAEDELANLSTNLSATYEELSLLYRISGSMRVTQGPADFLHTVCEELLEVMNISAAVAVEHGRRTAGGQDTLVIAGEVELDIEQLRNLLESAVVPRFAGDNRAIVENGFATQGEADLAAVVKNFVAVPLAAEDERIGVLVGINKRCGDFDSIDLKLLNSIGNQSSVFLANNRLYADLQELLMGVLHALTATIDAKDPYTCGHSQRVALLSRRIAEEMGLDEAKVEQIYLCGLLHDVGKIGVPESVLLKPGRLDEAEYRQVRLHPAIGAKILGGIRQWDDVAVGILTHHERPDGRGYPRGLSREKLPLEGLIVGLADCLDAMTSDRTYRPAMSLEQAVEEIRTHTGTQFDEKVVAAFLSMDLEALLAEARQGAEAVGSVSLADEEDDS